MRPIAWLHCFVSSVGFLCSRICEKLTASTVPRVHVNCPEAFTDSDQVLPEGSVRYAGDMM
jgi:hypothetical protein